MSAPMGLSIDELRDLAPAHVMGTLSLEERRAFDAAMRDPAIAAELEPELEAHRAAIDYLAASHAVAPPAALKARAMARISADRPATPIAPTPIAPTSTASTPTASRRSRTAWMVTGIAALAFAASAVFAVEMRSRANAFEERLAGELAARARLDSTVADRDRTLAALLDGGADLTVVRLTADQPREGPGMQVFWNRREGKAVVNATGLAPLAADRAYCLWIIRDGTPVPVKLFRVDAQGRALIQEVALPTDLAGIAAFALTEEPASGSPKPTMTPFLVGAVPRGG